jgi:hypothetical protein
MGSSSEGAAIYELARRILRSNGVKIVHNGQLTSEIEQLRIELSDSAPNIIFGIDSVIEDTEDIFFENQNSKDGVISERKPESIEIVWIVGNNMDVWKDLRKKIVELGNAGYPGCIGCGGPGSNEVWDEVASRARK